MRSLRKQDSEAALFLTFPSTNDAVRVLTDSHTPKDTSQMHQFIHAHEIHVQAAQDRRFKEALRAEQLKLVGPRSRFIALRAARLAIGEWLIGVGERIAHETARPTTTTTTTRRVASTA